MTHIVLLGDSIFDNDHYVPDHRDVAYYLRQKLGSATQVTLLARDGATTGTIDLQLARIPEDATHLVLSIGGNDALGLLPILEERCDTHAQSLALFASVRSRFAQVYGNLIRRLRERGLPLWLSTIYAPPMPGVLQVVAPVVLALFNDTILESAFREGIPVLDLRLVCTEAEDFVLDIEPSERGGAKIASAIASLLDPTAAQIVSQVYGSPAAAVEISSAPPLH